MLSQLSNLIPSSKRFSKQPAQRTVRLAPAEVYDIEASEEKPARMLRALLRLNHADFSILYKPDLNFYNHMPHLLSTAYLFGGDRDHLNRLYDFESKELEKWAPSPGEIGDDDWRGFLGKREYQRAFLDLFEDEVVLCGYDWKQTIEKYLYAEKSPLINSLLSGYGHPLIHLGFAYEMDNREVAMEALAMAASCYGDIHKYLDDASYSSLVPTYRTEALLEIIEKVQEDTGFDVIETILSDNFDAVFTTCESPILNHWAAWDTNDVSGHFQALQQFATALLVNSTKPHDFFFAHLLNTTHALRVIFPLIHSQYHVALLRQWWLFALSIYIARLRPHFDSTNTNDIYIYDTKERGWDWVNNQALNSKMSISVHYIKALRTMREAVKTWSDQEDFYLRAAVKFIDEFQTWEI